MRRIGRVSPLLSLPVPTFHFLTPRVQCTDCARPRPQCKSSARPVSPLQDSCLPSRRRRGGTNPTSSVSDGGCESSLSLLAIFSLYARKRGLKAGDLTFGRLFLGVSVDEQHRLREDHGRLLTTLLAVGQRNLERDWWIRVLVLWHLWVRAPLFSSLDRNSAGSNATLPVPPPSTLRA